MSYVPSETGLIALKEYAAKNGKNWKSKLLDDWSKCQPAGPLINIRNQAGPEWLAKFKLPENTQ